MIESLRAACPLHNAAVRPSLSTAMIHRYAPAFLLCFLLSSCVAIEIGSDRDTLEARGVFRLYASVDGFHQWSGRLLDFGLFTSRGNRDEIVSLEVGPIASVGVGLVGARARVLPFEIGVGSLFYDPSPGPRPRPEKEAESEQEVEAIEEEPAPPSKEPEIH